MIYFRRSLITAAVVALFLLLVGCIDVVQYISGDSNSIDVYLRLTLQKSAFEMASAFGDETQDLEQMFEDDFDLNEAEVLGEMPPGVDASFEQINTEFEYGFELRYSAPRGTFAELSAAGGANGGAFVPRVTSRKMVIPLSEGEGNEGGGEGDEFAAAFLGGAKYRVFVSKRLVSRISAAYLDDGGEAIDLEVTELADVWMIAFPVSLWLSGEGIPSVHIVY